MPQVDKIGVTSTHPVGCQDLGGQGVAQGSKAPDLVGDVLSTHDRDVDDHSVINEVQQFAVAHIHLGQRPTDGGQVLQHPGGFCKSQGCVMQAVISMQRCKVET